MMPGNQIQDNHWPNLEMNIFFDHKEFLELNIYNIYYQIYVNPVVNIFISMDSP